MNQRCDTCRFWMRLTEEEGVFTDGNFDTIAEDTGQCRFSPPAPPRYNPFHEKESCDSGDAANAALWPVTWDRHWCGQHKPWLVAIAGDAA